LKILSEFRDKRAARRLLKEEVTRERWEKGFFDMNSRILAEIPDDYLAGLQGGIRPETAAYIRAEHEWQRRLIVSQVRAALWASVIGVSGVIAGVILGSWLTQAPQTRTDKTSERQTQTEMTQPTNTPEPAP
jgi:hypothetical protein